MDIAPPFRSRQRISTDCNDERGVGQHGDHRNEAEPHPLGRKAPRTTDVTGPSVDQHTFRKPSLPASATPQANSLDRKPSGDRRQTRLSTLPRETHRAPSGSRDYVPSSPSISRHGSGNFPPNAVPPGVLVNTGSRAYLSQANHDAYSHNSGTSSRGNVAGTDVTSTIRKSRQPAALAPAHGRHYAGNGHTSASGDWPPPPSAEQDSARSTGFLPDINFDDFHTRIQNADVTCPVVTEFPSVRGGRGFAGNSARSTGAGTTADGVSGMARGHIFTTQQQNNPPSQPGRTDVVLDRNTSLRQRLGTGLQASGSSQQSGNSSRSEPKQSSLRSRRQSALPQTNPSQGLAPVATSSRAPRKSVGPGLISMMRGHQTKDKTVAKPVSESPMTSSELAHNRRLTINPPIATSGPFSPVEPTRHSKSKSLLPPPRTEENTDLTSPPASAKDFSHSGPHTPSSSGNRRQSVASGRLSGLGARTISPTDARRLKRMSTKKPPPMPTTSNWHAPPQQAMTSPQDGSSVYANALASSFSAPRLTQPSPSLIPRKTNNSTPTLSRHSPEARMYSAQSNPAETRSLVSKGSHSSLRNASACASSRLPTPKSRVLGQSSSSLAPYSDPGTQYSESDTGELVPPVPAIPKAFESPQDADCSSYFDAPMKSSQSNASDHITMPWLEHPPARPSIDSVRSGEMGQRSSVHGRTDSQVTSNAVASKFAAGAQSAASHQPLTHRQVGSRNGRTNAGLQPLHLPPLNLIPFNTRPVQERTNGLSHSGLEIDSSELWTTPEPARSGKKTPSTPMTASKATVFSRPLHAQSDEIKNIRSSSSHHALRDLLASDESGSVARYWDDHSGSEDNMAGGVPIYGNARDYRANPKTGNRQAITPFSSGSLPKSKPDFGYVDSELEDDPYSLNGSARARRQTSRPMGPRLRTGTITTAGSANARSPLAPQTPLEGQEMIDTTVEAAVASGEQQDSGSSGGLRRKLSLGWKRGSSKSANYADKTLSPQQTLFDLSPGTSNNKGDKKGARLQKRQSHMPASAGLADEVPTLPSNVRSYADHRRQGSLLGHARQKSQAALSAPATATPSAGVHADSEGNASTSAVDGAKTRAMRTEQPTKLASVADQQASSQGHLPRSKHIRHQQSRHKFTPSTLSALVKDRDDLVADDEMARLSKKRKDVDTAARESEELRYRAVARSPLTAEQVLHDRSLAGGQGLNVFERGEVVDYQDQGIYFTGVRDARKVVGSLSGHGGGSKDSSSAGGPNNFGYDDERGDYNIVMGDHLAYRYEVIDVLGKGSFGQVVRCVDHKEGGVVAVKIIRNKKRFHQQALVEVGILGRLGEWDPDGAYATLSITSSFYFRCHLCIVTPCLSINLYEFIRAHNFTGFSLVIIRRFARQMLACLTLLYSKRIIHCDLKPENILLCEARKADVRVIDFGSSCREEEKVYTYIQSRFYRSPEVILGSAYGLGIDMWSFGCILAELWTGYPLFPGENEQEQLACIMEIFGPPDRHLVDKCSRKKLFFDSVGKPRVTVSSKGRRRRPSSKTLQQALKTEDEAFVDFVARCLRWDPERRMKPRDAIAHSFVTGVPLQTRATDDARRAARGITTAPAATSSNANGSSLSPVKRTGAVAATPVMKARTNAHPETPLTAVKNGAPAAPLGGAGSVNSGNTSPSKPSARRQSTMPFTSSSSKRASNGGVMLPQQQAGARSTSGNLAALAARESMGVTGQAGGRWK